MKNKLIAVLIILLSFIPLKVFGLSMDTFIDWELDRSVFVHQIRNGEDHITNLAMITANGITAYCIEPGVLADKASYYNSTYDINDTPLGNIDIKYISLVGYYGYKYKSHDRKEYYMAAQELIWEKMGVTDVWYSDSKYGGNVLNVEKEKKEILALVNTHDKTPKFNLKDKYIIGDNISVSDVNNVLKDYEVIGNDDVIIENNNIKINVKNHENSFSLKRKSNGKVPKFYYKSGYQTIGSFEYAYDVSCNYKVLGEYGKIIVDKKDFDNKNKQSLSVIASLKGAKYGLYNEKGELLLTKYTDENGYITFDNLIKGKYFIKEISPSKGYTLDLKRHEVLLDSNSFQVKIDSFEKIIKNKLYITKVLDNEDGTFSKEENILFSVINSNGKEVLKLFTNEKGMLEFELPYGEYILRQVSSPSGVLKADDLKITINEDGLEQHFKIVNKKLPIIPKTGKNSTFIIILIILDALAIIGYLYEKKNI